MTASSKVNICVTLRLIGKGGVLTIHEERLVGILSRQNF